MNPIKLKAGSRAPIARANLASFNSEQYHASYNSEQFHASYNSEQYHATYDKSFQEQTPKV
jgi:hypothetical protein